MSYKEIRQTLSKKDCQCSKCQKEIKKGSPVIFDPRNKAVYHLSCGRDLKTKP